MLLLTPGNSHSALFVLIVIQGFKVAIAIIVGKGVTDTFHCLALALFSEMLGKAPWP